MKIERFEELEKAATPGPWHIGWIDENLNHAEIEGPELGQQVGEIYPRVDQSFICNFRNVAPHLIAVAKAAKEIARELKGSVPSDIVGNAGAEMIEDLIASLAALEAEK